MGTVRFDAPDLLGRHTDGQHVNLTGLWRDITKPLRSHLVQGDIYLHLAHVLGLPFTQIVYLYESKWNQMTKEFTIKYSPDRVKPLVAKVEAVKYAVEHAAPPRCVRGPGGCKECNAFPQRPRRTVAGTRTDFTCTRCARGTRWPSWTGGSPPRPCLRTIHAEREAQHAQWGEQDIPMGTHRDFTFAVRTNTYRALCQRKTQSTATSPTSR